MTANPYDQSKKNNKACFLHLKNRNTLKHVFKKRVAIHPKNIISFRNEADTLKQQLHNHD